MGWESSTRRAELPKDWNARRRRVLKRDGGRCTWTIDGVRCPAKATDVHHAVAKDDHRLAALVSLCAEHHDLITKRQAAAAQPTMRHPVEAHPGVLSPTPGG